MVICLHCVDDIGTVLYTDMFGYAQSFDVCLCRAVLLGSCTSFIAIIEENVLRLLISESNIKCQAAPQPDIVYLWCPQMPAADCR